MKKEIPVNSFCSGDSENHFRCYFCREFGSQKFCGLWMRNIIGAFNPKKRMFKSAFCNPCKVTIETEMGPALNENPVELEIGGRTISSL